MIGPHKAFGWSFGTYCGVTLRRPYTWWKHYGLFRIRRDLGPKAFGVGPFYLWKSMVSDD